MAGDGVLFQYILHGLHPATARVERLKDLPPPRPKVSALWCTCQAACRGHEKMALPR